MQSKGCESDEISSKKNLYILLKFVKIESVLIHIYNVIQEIMLDIIVLLFLWLSMFNDYLYI